MFHPGGRPVAFTWDYDRGELLADGIVHAVGVVLAVVGAVALVIVSAASTHGLETASILIYAAGLLAMLGLSAAYNMWPISSGKWLLRRFDHSAIYLLIAATYTPFVAKMGGGLVPLALLAWVWSISIIGIALKLLLPGRFDRLAVVLYLLLGWSAVVAYRPVIDVLPSSTLWLLAAGGLLYTAGVVFHLWHSLRFQNAIWHGFVLAAALCHYTAVLGGVALG